MRLVNGMIKFAIPIYERGIWENMMDAVVIDYDENSTNVKCVNVKKGDRVRVWTYRLTPTNMEYKEGYTVYLGNVGDIIGVYDQESETKNE